MQHKKKQLGSRTAEVWDYRKTMDSFRRFGPRLQHVCQPLLDRATKSNVETGTLIQRSPMRDLVIQTTARNDATTLGGKISDCISQRSAQHASRLQGLFPLNGLAFV